MKKLNLLIFLNIGLLFIALIEPSPSDILFLFMLIFAFKDREVILNKMRRQKLYFTCMNIFLIISSLSLIYSISVGSSLKYYFITVYLIFYSFIIFSFSDESNYKWILRVYIIAGSIAAFLGILGYLGLGPDILTYDASRTKSLFKDPNVFGPYLVPSIIFIIYNLRTRNLFKSIVLSLIMLTLNFTGLILSFSRGAYISLAAALFIYLILNIKYINFKKVIIFVLIFTSAVCITWFIFLSQNWKEFFLYRLQLHSYDSMRFSAQLKGLDLSLTHFFGFGPGQFGNVMAIYYDERIAAHSLYIRMLVECGILASIFFFTSFIYLIIQLSRISRKGNDEIKNLTAMLLSITCGVLINSLVIDSVHWRHLWLISGLSLSLIDAAIKKAESLQEGFTVEVLTDINKLKDYEDKWNSLLEENKNNNLYLEQSYIIKYWQYFHSGNKLFILILKKDNEIIAFCPLMKKRKLLYSLISFIGMGQCSHMDFIIGNKYREEALKNFLYYLKDMKGSYVLNLFGIEDTSPNLKILCNLLRGSKHYYKSIENRYININSNFIDYFNLRKKHWTLKSIKKKGSRLKKLGTLTYENISPENLDYTFSLHEKRWLKKLNGSSYSKKETREFLKDLLLDKSLPFKAEIKTLMLNKIIVAYGYIFKYRDRFLFHRVCHDQDFAAFSPGILFSCILIEDAFLQEYKIFDFSTGYERFKEDWTDDILNVYTFIIPSSSYAAEIYFYVSLFMLKLRNLLKKSNLLVSFKKKRLGRIAYIFSLTFIMGIKNMLKLRFCDLCGYLFPAAPADASQYKILKLSVNNLTELSVLPQLKKSEIIKKMINGDTCIYIKDKERIIHCCFLSKSKIYESHTAKRFLKSQSFFNKLVYDYLKISV